MSGSVSRLPGLRDGAIGRHLGDLRARLAQLLRQHLARDVRLRHQDARAFERCRRRARSAWRIDSATPGAMFRRRSDRTSTRSAPAVPRWPAPRPRASDPSGRGRRPGLDSSSRMKCSTPFWLREHNPVEFAGLAAGLGERLALRRPASMRTVGASMASAPSSSRRSTRSPACSRARVTMMRLAEQRTRIEPAQVIAQRCDAADDQHRRRLQRLVRQLLVQFVERADGGLLVRQRAGLDHRGRFLPASVRWPAATG